MADKHTSNEPVYLGIRTEILAGERAPGSRLPTAELCARYGASVGVVRESLLRLAEHGLVQVRPMQGFRVAELSESDLADLTQARLDIETLALRYSVEQGDNVWESHLVGTHHLLSTTPRRGTDGQPFTPEWGRAHGAFHAALLAGCHNQRIVTIAQRLRDSAELYRRWSVSAEQQPPRDIAAEHRALLDAVIARDADLAVEHLATHIRRSNEELRLPD
jgi:DNA-binding GntR family transcriptional regulator